MLFFLQHQSQAQQTGFVFPTHRFPTDKSFHVQYSNRFTKTSSNFISSQFTDVLANSGQVFVHQHKLLVETQPNRRFSAGLELSFDRVSLENLSAENSATKFGDQRLFMEYRFFDVVGASAGFAFVAKFPAYSNSSLQELQASGNALSPRHGDAQSDFGILLTGEYWPSEAVRFRTDLGYLYRTSGYATQLPYLASLGVVTQKVDAELRLVGNFSLGGETSSLSAQDESDLSDSVLGSNYFISRNPWMLMVEPRVEVWFSPKWALSFGYKTPLIGNRAAKFHSFALGIVYRWFETKRSRPRTFQQVDIETDQESGVFQGENQENLFDKSPQPRRREPIGPETNSTLEDQSPDASF
jgi:hypothetical protein